MVFWTILTVLACAATALVSVPLVRRFEARTAESGKAMNVFADQLSEIERDKDAGLTGAAEADLARAEIGRRMLAAAKPLPASRPVSAHWRMAALAGMTAFVALGSVNLYVLLGRSDLASAPPAKVETTTAELPKAGAGQVDELIAGIEAKLKTNPGDAEGWRMLGWSYFNTQRYEQSAAAYAKAMALAPDNLDYKASYAEALVQQAGGIVTPAAREVFATVLKADPKSFLARFYDALATEQAGDQKAALDKWTALLADAPPDAGWIVDVKQRIADLGKATGTDVSGALTAAKTPAAASDDQSATIEGMIAKLAAKLEANPRDRDGWGMMMRSLKVRGDLSSAKAAYNKALAAFADDPATRQQLTAYATTLGLGDGGEAQKLPPADQQEMIAGMVERLAERLDKSPHDAEGWQRLIQSRMVLQQQDLAKVALDKALAEFASEPATKDQLIAFSRSLGLTPN